MLEEEDQVKKTLKGNDKVEKARGREVGRLEKSHAAKEGSGMKVAYRVAAFEVDVEGLSGCEKIGSYEVSQIGGIGRTVGVSTVARYGGEGGCMLERGQNEIQRSVPQRAEADACGRRT